MVCLRGLFRKRNIEIMVDLLSVFQDQVTKEIVFSGTQHCSAPTGLFQASGNPPLLPWHTSPCSFPLLFTKAIDRQSKQPYYNCNSS